MPQASVTLTAEHRAGARRTRSKSTGTCCPFLALKTSRELKGCLLVCGSPELRARAAGTTAPRSKTSKGALGLEKDIKNSELFILGYKNNTAQIPPLPLQFRPALWGG